MTEQSESTDRFIVPEAKVYIEGKTTILENFPEIAVGRIWDAFNDLFVGTLSDRTRSRWGRRRPYLLFGAIPLGIAFVLMWLVPPTDQQALLLIYYTATYILFDTLFTLSNVPYIALTPEIAPTYDERTSLHSYRMAFSIGLGLVSAIAPLAIVSTIAGPNPSLAERRAAYAAMAVIIALVGSIALSGVLSLNVRERTPRNRGHAGDWGLVAGHRLAVHRRGLTSRISDAFRTGGRPLLVACVVAGGPTFDESISIIRELVF